MRLTRTAADLSLILAAAIWGGSFVIVRDAVRTVPPLLLIGLRFLLALAALLVFFPRSLRNWRADLGPGLILGCLLFGGFTLQTFGLCHVKASTSGFITGLNVVFVASIAAVTSRHKLPAPTVLGVVLAAVGLTVLSWHRGGWGLGLGELLTLACAVVFALHITVTERFAPGRDPASLTGIQFAMVGLCSLALNALTGGAFVIPAVSGWLALVYLGLAATGLAFFIQTAAQRYTPSTDTAVILSAESVFAAFVAVLWGGEQPTPRMLVGGGAIFAATLLSVLAPVPEAQKKPPRPHGGRRAARGARPGEPRQDQRRAAPS